MEYTLRQNPWSEPEAIISLEGGRDDARDRARPREPADPEAVKAARSAVVEHVEAFVGRQVTLQAWDPIMVVLDEEGPFPIAARVVELVETGAIPALRLDNARSRKTPDGYDLLPELERAGESILFPVDRLYWIED